MALDWMCVPRQITLDKYHLSVAALEHPLKLNSNSVIDNKGTRATHSIISCYSKSLLDDSFINLDGTDPLSQFAAHSKELAKMECDIKLTPFCKDDDNAESKISVDLWSWNPHRLQVLNKFTTSEKITIRTSFLNTAMDSVCGTSAASIKVQRISSDKTTNNLDQLDNFENNNVREMVDLTQSEYVQFVKQLNKELVQSWCNDQRVNALKIAIQCSKMLSDTSVLTFYPSQFILITDVLDMFGKLVYERLKKKSLCGTSYSEDKVSSTCLNWFFKIASIRELLPRLYMEICLLKCYEFMKDCSYGDILQRLNEMIRGISHPLVAIYIRCYLVRVAVIIYHDSLYIYRSLQETLRCYHMIFFDFEKKKSQSITNFSYLSVYEPALNLILAALMHKNCNYAEDVFKDIINLKNNALLLACILHTLKSEFISAKAVDVLNAIASMNSTDVRKSHLICKFGYKMSNFGKLCEDHKLLLQSIFRLVNKFNDPDEYLNCLEAWSDFLGNITITEANNLFAEAVRRLGSVKLLKKQYKQLKTILFKIFSSHTYIELLLAQEHFLPFMELFHKDTLKCALCKYILMLYKKNSQGDTVDSVVINALFYLSKTLNDSITNITVVGEKALIAELICFFIRKVNFCHDVEHQLIFYAKARAAFSKFDTVYCALVYAVSKLAMLVYSNISGKHTRKSRSFVKACVAFNYVTIPSITCKLQQMNLYAHNGEVALVNLCYGQADANFEMALRVVYELPKSIDINGKQCSLDSHVVCFLKKMLATLILIPDSPDKGVLYLLRLLLEIIQKCTILENNYSIIALYLHTLDMLYHQSLKDFPHQNSEVKSSDALYGHDMKFIDEINNLCGYVVQQILKFLPLVGLSQEFPLQAHFATELLLRILRYADLEKEKIYTISINLWCLIKNHKNYLDSDFEVRKRVVSNKK